MSRGLLQRYADRMDTLIGLSGELNSAVAAAAPREDVVLMNRVNLWLTLALTFDGFVGRASQVFQTESAVKEMKADHTDWPDVLVRLKVLQRDKNVRLALREECWEAVVRRHYTLRNKWAHDLGMVEKPDTDMLRIISWDEPSKTGWISECGWSEFRDAVANLSRQVLAAAAPS